MAANNEYFNQSALLKARGFTTNAEGMTESNGGIINPLRVHVRPGQYLYRFASSSRPQPMRIQGCWWVEYEVLTKIAGFSRMAGGSPRHAARYFLALPWSWTKVDRLIRALLVEKIDAYRGEGKPAAGDDKRDANTRFIPPQHIRELYQLYIPGMDRDGFAHKVLTEVSEVDIRDAAAFH